jgi:CDP-diacylglycerol--serine O-phosphatidyltransferase
MLAIMLAVAAPHGEMYGSILIVVAAVLDRYDGKIARKLDVTSDFGKELDSLSDLVSFGLAPSLLAWHLGLRNLGWIGIVIALLFLSAGAYRLARFNITTGQTVEYTGIPITVAGALLSLYTIYVNLADMSDNALIERFTLFFMIVLSYLMVSKFKIRKM